MKQTFTGYLTDGRADWESTSFTILSDPNDPKTG